MHEIYKSSKCRLRERIFYIKASISRKMHLQLKDVFSMLQLCLIPYCALLMELKRFDFQGISFRSSEVSSVAESVLTIDFPQNILRHLVPFVSCNICRNAQMYCKRQNFPTLFALICTTQSTYFVIFICAFSPHSSHTFSLISSFRVPMEISHGKMWRYYCTVTKLHIITKNLENRIQVDEQREMT